MKTLLKFGLYSGVTLVLLSQISYMFIHSVIIGYLSMLVALVFVYFGVKSYRDQQLHHEISFGKAFGLGLLIALVPSVFLGIADTIYITYVHPEFIADYYADLVAEATKNLTGKELVLKIDTIKEEERIASMPMATFILMFSNVFVLGFIVSLISAIFLRTPAAKNPLRENN